MTRKALRAGRHRGRGGGRHLHEGRQGQHRGSIAVASIMVLIGTTVNMNGIPFATSNIIKAAIIIFALAIQRERSV